MSSLETIKRSLRNYLPTSVNIDDFIKAEMTLALLEKCKPEGDPTKAYLLLHNYSLLGEVVCDETAFLLQKAHRLLHSCSSKMNWAKVLENYRNAQSEFCLYIFTEKIEKGSKVLKFARNTELAVEPDRAYVYFEYIRKHKEERHFEYAKGGKYSYSIKDKTSSTVYSADVKIPDRTPQMPVSPPPKKTRKTISVSTDELLASAAEMAEKKPDDYCYSILKSNTLKAVTEGNVKSANRLEIDKITNLVGMVGSGKSTLMKVLSYHLAKADKKVVLVLDTVSSVLEMCYYLSQFGVSVSPVIGRSGREKYIDQVAKAQEKYLQNEYSKYLTAPCIIDGMAKNKSDKSSAPMFGNEPCRSLMKNKKHYNCPYMDICPAVRMYREVYTSNVIVTTVQGLAAIRLLGDNKLFLEYVLEQADLVIFDECDKVQKTLDEFFTPSASFDKFRQNAATLCSEAMNKETEALDGMEKNESGYIRKLMRSLGVCMAVREAISAYGGTWRTILSRTFSAEILYQAICRENQKNKYISDKSLEHMRRVTIGLDHDKDIEHILKFALSEDDIKIFSSDISDWLTDNNCKPDKTFSDHIKLYLVVAAFDNYIREISDSYLFLPYERKTQQELTDFLSTRFTAQQKILPSSAMGNLFGMKNDPQKRLILYRQYAFGRALMDRMPWLRLTEEGQPAGPNVLMLSGSSWADGCLQYHVNVPVKYLLEAEEWKRRKIAESKMIDLGTAIRVSVSGSEEREENLTEVIKKIMGTIEAELRSEGKLLMIVNSYSEAQTAANYLNRLLSNGKTVACMCREADEFDENMILRSEIADFSDHSADIMVAPAQAIERGYNIVDKDGHSAFGSVFFLVRPMEVPDEISSKCTKLNGYLERHCVLSGKKNAFDRAAKLRSEATRQWSLMERQGKMQLSSLDPVMKLDVTASLFVLILQIFGRLCRITDESKPAPRVYFADGAFRRSEKNTAGYDLLNELIDYLDSMIDNKETGKIAETLYQPFYEAFKKGVEKNEFVDISDDIYSEEEEF
uniref:pPIWI_RE_Z domain-containing protein n=1 Tax=Ruminococcus bicirculans (ex Wegman et al. 2014) TaxID=1160721 RepID=UPI003FEF6F2F